MFDKEEIRKILLAVTIITIALVAHHLLANMSAVFRFISWILDILSPLTVGFVIFYIINIPMKSLERIIFKRSKLSPSLKRATSLILTMVLFGIFLTLFILVAIPQLIESIANLVNQSGDIAASISDFFIRFFRDLNISDELIAQGEEIWTGFLGSFANVMMNLVNSATNLVSRFLSGVFSTIISMVLAVYMLLGKEHLGGTINKLWQAYSPKRITKPTLEYLGIIDNAFEQFVRGQLMEALVLGIVCYIGMLIFGFEYALLISFLVGVTNIIPIFGPYIGAIPSFLILLGVNPVHALWFIVYVTVLQQLEANLIYPRVVGEAMGISGFWIMIAVLVGNSLFGIVGILLGIPLLSSMYSIVREATEKRLAARVTSKMTEAPTNE